MFDSCPGLRFFFVLRLCCVHQFAFQIIICLIIFFFSEASERQITRKELMNEYCLKHSYKTKLVGKDLSFITVDDENKIIYCSIPKVSSTTWTRVLGDLRGLDKNTKHIHSKKWWRRLYQYTDEEKLKRIQTYFKFLFVREPLHRLLSAYKDKFMKRDMVCSKNARKQIVKAHKIINPTIMTSTSPLLSLFSIFLMMCRGIDIGDNTKSSVIHVLLTTISLVT